MPAPPPSENRYKGIFLLLGVSLSLALGWCGYQEIPVLTRSDNAFYDLFSVQKTAPLEGDDVVIVDIDDISLQAAGQWPWPRYRVARLIDLISSANPSAIGLDIVFPEPDRTALITLKDTFQTEFGIDLGFTGVPPGLEDNDGFLGQVASRGPVVGATYFYFDHTSSNESCGGPGLSLGGRGNLSFAPQQATGILCSIPAINHGFSRLGFINTRSDRDGILRGLPLLIEYQGNLYPSLGLATYLQSRVNPQLRLGRNMTGPALHVGNRTIPIDNQGYVYLRFSGVAREHSYISAIDLLNGNNFTEKISGKMVIIGSSAAGMSDIHHTAIDPQFPGVETHAVLIDNIIHGNFVRIPSWAPHVNLAVVLLAGILVTVMFFGASLFIPLGGTVCLIGAIFLGSFLLFDRLGVFFSPAAPLLCIVSLFTLFSATRYALEKKRAFAWYRQLANVQQVSLEAMATLAETRDPETGGHIKRTQYYARVLARYLMRQPKFRNTLTTEYIERLYISAPLHDVGKVGIPDSILLKPGKLTGEEFEIMKKHTEYGSRIIEKAVAKIKGENFLSLAGEIAISHHEKWDGSGYPKGLSRDEIPLSGRILAVADVYDALISTRCYKKAISHEKALEILVRDSGRHFDPDIVSAFCACQEEMQTIAGRFGDEPATAM